MTTPDNSGTHATLADSGDSPNSQELPRGSNLGRYVIIEPIGSGGMGTVYRAYDPQLNRGVALKILSVKHSDLGAAEKAKGRLIREAQALAQLSHPNVVAVHDAGTFEDDVFIAMELVEGKTLDEWMRQKKRSVKEILEVMISAGRGLSAAHKAGLIHRDFKPGNVMVGDDGRVRVLDFGLVRAADQQESISENPKSSQSAKEIADELSQESNDPIAWKEISSGSSPNLLQSPLTHAGGILGTPMYMAPEQHLGLKTDERTDQFGFCIVLYEALFGNRPFLAKTMEELKSKVIRRHIRMPPTDTDIPAWLWHIIRKGLSADPEDRYPTIESLIEDLDKDPGEAKASRRRKQIWTTVIILVATMPFGFGYYAFLKSSKLCTGADKKVAGVWHDERKAKVRQAFASTELSYANDTFIRIEKQFGEYLQIWKNDYTETCKATRMRGEQSVEIMALKMECLNKLLRNAAALARVFADADKTVVGKAIQAVSSLSGFSTCHDVESLQSRIPPPKNEKAKIKVAAIRERLADVEALIKTGKYREGMKQAKKLEKEASEVDFKPVQVEALYHLGALLERSGEYKKAETTLHKAAYMAGESRDAVLVAEAMSKLVWVVGYMQSRYEEGLSFGRAAEIMLVFAGGGNSEVWSRLFNNLGGVLLTKGDYDKALHNFRNALKSHEKAFGSDHPLVASTLNNIGVLFEGIGDYDKSLKYYQRAMEVDEKALGTEHPELAQTFNNVGLVHWKKRDYKKAEKYFHRALAVGEKSLGKDHPLIAWPLSGLGEVYLATKKPKEALGKFTRTKDICENKKCQPEPHGQGLFGLSRSLFATGGDKELAFKLAKQAREVYGKSPKVFKKELEEVSEWLKKHDRSNSGTAHLRR